MVKDKLIVAPRGEPDIVNLLETHTCRICGEFTPKRGQMWKYPDGEYMCITCKTRLNELVTPLGSAEGENG